MVVPVAPRTRHYLVTVGEYLAYDGDPDRPRMSSMPTLAWDRLESPVGRAPFVRSSPIGCDRDCVGAVGGAMADRDRAGTDRVEFLGSVCVRTRQSRGGRGRAPTRPSEY